jgi:hypothetical protein
VTPQTLNLSSVLTAVENSGLFVSLCTIQSPASTLNAIRQPDLVTYTNVSGLVDIKCMLSVLGIGIPASEETKDPEYTREQRERHCLLDGHFPSIIPKYRAVVDGTAYDILSVQHDSQAIMTRMHLRRVDF